MGSEPLYKLSTDWVLDWVYIYIYSYITITGACPFLPVEPSVNKAFTWTRPATEPSSSTVTGNGIDPIYIYIKIYTQSSTQSVDNLSAFWGDWFLHGRPRDGQFCSIAC